MNTKMHANRAFWRSNCSMNTISNQWNGTLKNLFCLFCTVSVAFAVSVFSSAWAQGLANQFQSFDIPYPEDGIQLGQGWDTAIGHRRDAQCLGFSTSDIERAASNLQIRTLKDTFSLLAAKNQAVSVSGNGFGISASASYSRSASLTLNTDYLNYLLSYTLDGSGSFVSPSTESNHPSNGTPRDVSEVGISTRIRDELQHYRDSAPETPSIDALLGRFEALCGDYFVSAIRHGIRINILATYASESRKERETVKAAVRAKGFGVTASASADEESQAGYDVEKFHFVLDQEGIKNALVPAVRSYSEVESLIESIATDSALRDPAAYLVTLTPYSILPDWQELFNPESQDVEFVPLGHSRPRLSDVARLYSAYRDLYRLLDQGREGLHERQVGEVWSVPRELACTECV